MWLCPRWQAGHFPHQSSGMTVTGSPTAHPVIPGPSSAIRPDISWPIDGGWADPVVHGAVQDVQVGAADAGVRDVDANLARTWGN